MEMLFDRRRYCEDWDSLACLACAVRGRIQGYQRSRLPPEGLWLEIAYHRIGREFEDRSFEVLLPSFPRYFRLGCTLTATVCNFERMLEADLD